MASTSGIVPEASLNFVSAFQICPESSDLNCILEEADMCNSDAQYKELIDTILSRYSQEYDNIGGKQVRNVVMEFFIKSCSKKNLRKYMYEKLNSITLGEKSLFEYIVDDVTTEMTENLKDSGVFNNKQCFHMLCFLFSYTQNFSNNSKYEYLLERTFPFYLSIMDVFTSQLFNKNITRDGCEGKYILEYEDCYSVLNNALKQLVLAVPRSNHTTFKHYSVRMIEFSYEIMRCHSYLKFETMSRCGLLFAYFLNIVPCEEREHLKWKQYPILDFIDNESSNFSIVLKSKKLPNLFDSDPMKVVLNVAVYNSVTAKTLLELHIENVPLLEFIYFNIIRLGNQMTSCPEQIIQITRTIEGMSKNLLELENFAQVFHHGLKFCWSHLDHFIEHVVTTTKTFLCTLVLHAVTLYERGQVQLLEDYFHDLNSMSVFSKVRLNGLYAVCEHVHCDYILKYCPQIQNQLLALIANSALHDVAGHTYVHLMERHLAELPPEQAIRLWLRPVMNILKQPNIKYGPIFEEIITYAFRFKPPLFRKLFNPKTAGSGAECAVVLKCIHCARMNGIVLPMDEDAIEEEYWRNLIVKNKLDLFMIHQDDEVRIGALQAIAECQKSTEEFTEWELVYLVRFFQYNVSTQVASFRNKIASYYKKIFTRYQSSYAILAKKVAGPEEPDEEEEVRKMKKLMEEYRHFLLHFVQTLVLYLSPDANYSRRSITLELLIYLHGICDQREWQTMFRPDDISNLKHILNDSYESNKALAVSVLKTLPSAAIGFDSEESTRKYFDKCVRMACDIKPSQSLSACYMFQVVLQSEFPFRKHDKSALEMTDNTQCLMLMAITEKLEHMFQSSNEDVMEAAKSTPFYGLLLSARHLLRNRDIRENIAVYAVIFNKLATLCLTMKSHIMPVVCNSSPEGHLPDSDESDDSFLESDQSSKAQMILVYSWKTMKEIMLVLAELANQTVTLENVLDMLSEEYLLNIGDFFMDIFVQTKHRGVFEQAHVAFSTICRSFIHSKNENLNNLPVKWLNEAIALCTGTKIDDRLCPTRRSAGLPFLILSIVPILSETNRDYLKRTIEPLLATAGKVGEDNDESRMHCLNVLRFMFNNSKLSNIITVYIDRGVIAALLGFKSKTWGVRNSATLLLSTLITKMFGVPRSSCGDSGVDNCDKNRMTLAVFHVRYPKLFDFLLDTLVEESEKVDSLLLHPVLWILSRLYPSHNDKINGQMKRHVRCINTCIANPSYRTRDLAARASVSLISEHCLQIQLDENFNRISDRKLSDTECHGLLLQIRHIFHTTIFDELPISDYLTKSMHLLSQAGRQSSHLTVTLYMDIIFMLLTKYRDYKNLEVLEKMVVLLKGQSKGEITTCRTSFVWSRYQLAIFILVNKFQHVSSIYRTVTRIIIQSLYSDDLETKKKFLHFLIYLNQQYSEDQYREHPLITAGEVEICPMIKALVHSLDLKSKKEILTSTHRYLIYFFCIELEVQNQRHNDDYFVLIFLLLRFYPCFFFSFSNRTDQKRHMLNWFLSTAKGHNEEIVSAVISCLKTFITVLSQKEMKMLKCTDLVKLLMESSAPGAADYRRLSVAQFLVGTQVLFKSKILSEFDRYNVLNMVMVLLEDDESLVRKTMSTFPTKKNKVATAPALWHVIPNKARSTLLVSITSDFRNDVAICCLVSWALRRLPQVTSDASEVYERGELNTFAENIPVIRCAARVLHSLLWTLGQDLSYEDKSIFLEEQTLLVTTVVFNALIKIPSPMMDRQTKRTVICVFKCIAKFLEDCTVGTEFRINFQTFFNAKILKFLRVSLRTDYFSVKTFLTYLYNPILNVHFRFPLE